MSKIVRLTLFKIPKSEDVQAAIAKYSSLTQEAKKGGSQYISFASAAETIEDERSQGFTLVARTVFDSLDDMKYYDEECEAHKSLKALLRPADGPSKVAGPPLTVYFKGQ